ncbi:2-dehydropantoate 2-reductase [Pseudonocardia sp. CNS-139]|nr:2-dehydropantoate 2-reductase [Pseudonocardia sp. CNS-139]
MRYIVIGAGAVGGTIGGRLHQSGRDVVLVARGEHLARLREEGLLLVTPDGEHKLDVPAAGGPEELALTAEDVLVLAVKSQATEAALRTWADAPVRGGGRAGDRLAVVTAQNGVENERVALRLFRHVYAMCVWLPGTFLEPGRVVAEAAPLSGMLMLGRYPSGVDARAEAIAADLDDSRFAVFCEPDVMRWKYGKLLTNLDNGLDALFGRTSGAEGLAEVAGAVREEAAAVLAAAGIAAVSGEEQAARRGDRVRVRPVAGHRRQGSSTWQSLARGTGDVEVDQLNGEIVLLGRLHGIPTPVNEAVQTAVRDAVRRRLAPATYPMDDLRALIAS